MADLSKLSDEQLEVYRDLLQAKSAPVPAAPAPKSAKHANDMGGSGPGGTPNTTQDTSFGGRFAGGATRANLEMAGNPEGSGGILAPVLHPLKTLAAIPQTVGGVLSGDPETLGGLAGAAPYSLLGTRGLPTPAEATSGLRIAGKTAGAAAKAAPGALADNISISHPLKAVKALPEILSAGSDAMRSARSDEAAASHAAANPPRIVPPVARPPIPDMGSIPAEGGTLPSGRRPGRPAFDAGSGEQLNNLPNGEFSSEPPAAPKAPTFDVIMGGLKNKLQQRGIVPPDYKWGQGDTGPGFRERFDEGGPSPTIQPARVKYANEVSADSPLMKKPGALAAAKAMADAMKKSK